MGLTGASLRRPRHADARPLGEQPRLQPEHLGVLLGLGVVVAEQVQDAVDGQQVDLVADRAGLARASGLPLGDLGAEHEVTEDALLGLLVDQARAAARPSGTPARRSGPRLPIHAR